MYFSGTIQSHFGLSGGECIVVLPKESNYKIEKK